MDKKDHKESFHKENLKKVSNDHMCPKFYSFYSPSMFETHS